MSSLRLQYYNIKDIYNYVLVTRITGHRNTRKKTKGQVKFALQVVGQEKSQKKKRQFGKPQISFQIFTEM